jgi:Flp pilus assembly protein TadD
MKRVYVCVALTGLIAGCALPPPYSPASRPAPVPVSPSPSAREAPSGERPTPPPLTAEDPIPTYSPGSVRPEPPPTAAPVRFTLTPATEALVGQARRQAGSGEFGAAAGTVERALRIEPDNPLVWIELGRIRLTEGNAAQAESVGRKAAALARGDDRVEASAWQLVADALQARGRTAEAIEAESRARALRTR